MIDLSTNLPCFEMSDPTVSDPISPPMQKMDTVKDQIRDNCHFSKDRLYLSRHVWLTKSLINLNKKKILINVRLPGSGVSIHGFTLKFDSHFRRRSHHRHRKTILKSSPDPRDKNGGDDQRVVQLKEGKHMFGQT